MVPHQPKTIITRTMQASAVLLAGVLLSSCGQQPSGVEDVSFDAEQALVKPSASTSAPPSSDTVAATTAAPSTSRPSATRTAERQEAPAGRTEAQTSQESPRVTRCHTSMLAAGLRQGHPGAGQRYAELVLHNDSGQACTVYGYPGLQLIGSNGQPLPTEVARTENPAPRTVRLAPGDSTAATLHWGVVPTGDEPATGPCQPKPAHLQVIPPDETDSLTIEWPFGRVCGGGHISTTAFH